MKAYIAAASVVSALLLASPAAPQGQKFVCQSLTGESVDIAGKIDSIRVEGGVAIYVIDQADLPCLAPEFSVQDPGGQPRCQQGQRIIASGVVNATDAKAWVSTASYSCQ
jgi:hypothetical protein